MPDLFVVIVWVGMKLIGQFLDPFDKIDVQKKRIDSFQTKLAQTEVLLLIKVWFFLFSLSSKENHKEKQKMKKTIGKKLRKIVFM